MRTFEDYKNDVLSDGKDRIDECGYESWDDCYDDLFLTVTGNDNGSYFCNRYKAAQAVAGLEFDEDFLTELEYSFGTESLVNSLKRGPEDFDVLVRLVALGCVADELGEYYESKVDE